jgi:hypothetical protein
MNTENNIEIAPREMINRIDSTTKHDFEHEGLLTKKFLVSNASIHTSQVNYNLSIH